jgi:hypothetical protein
MKDATQIALEATRPETSVSDTIAYCLNRLYADTQHTLTQEVVQGLTFEELIGTLLQARDLHEQMQEMMKEEVAPHVSAGLSQF